MFLLAQYLSVSWVEEQNWNMGVAWGVSSWLGHKTALDRTQGADAWWPDGPKQNRPVLLSLSLWCQTTLDFFLAHIPLDVVSLHNSRKGKGTLWTLHHSRYILKWKLWRWELWWWWRENVLALGSPPLMSLPLPYNWTVCKNLDYIPLFALLSYALTLCAAFLTSLEASKLTSLLLFFTRGS